MNALQALRGAVPLRYHFEIIPTDISGLNLTGGAVSVSVESGSKLCYSDPSPLDNAGGAVFATIMRMTSNVYKQGTTMLPKEYSVKISHVRHKPTSPAGAGAAEGRRRTIARAKLDVAAFCDPISTPGAREVELLLAPAGRLKLTVRAVWLQHTRPGNNSVGDAATGSELESNTERSSVTFGSSMAGSSCDGDDSEHDNDEVRASSADLDALVDYHLRAAQQQQQVLPELPLPPSPDVQQQQQQQQQQRSPPPSGHGVVRGGVGAGRSTRTSHRRALSASNRPPSSASITPIEEVPDREGIEAVGGSMEYIIPGELHAAATAAAVAAADAAAVASAAAQASGQQVGPAADSSGTGLAAAPGGVQRTLSGHLPAWLWPSSRSVVRGITTDDLMRQIAACSADAPRLQQISRGLLCERNDWRHQATQWERSAAALQTQVDVLTQTKAQLGASLAAAEAQLSQLQGDALVDKLVEAKLALAQSDLAVSTLRGDLQRERERGRTLAARLTAALSRAERAEDSLAAINHAGHREQEELGEGVALAGTPPQPTWGSLAAGIVGRFSSSGGPAGGGGGATPPAIPDSESSMAHATTVAAAAARLQAAAGGRRRLSEPGGGGGGGATPPPGGCSAAPVRSHARWSSGA